MKRKPPSLDKPYPRYRPLSPEETELWRAAMGELKVQESETETQETDAELPPLTPPAGGRGTGKSLPPPAGGVAGGNSHRPASTDTTPAKLDKPTLARIRRGTAQLNATLDLHGHTKATAHAALLSFIMAAQARGVPLVLIITGKGRRSGGTLREELPRWLRESPLREAIIAYDVAGPRHGGEGAWYVRIRKRKK